jgi:hypothetical protein
MSKYVTIFSENLGGEQMPVLHPSPLRAPMPGSEEFSLESKDVHVTTLIPFSVCPLSVSTESREDKTRFEAFSGTPDSSRKHKSYDFCFPGPPE